MGQIVEATSQQLDQSVATRLADSVITKLFVEVDKVAATPVDEAWFNALLDAMEFSKSVEVGFGHGKAYILALVKQHWNEVPFSIRNKYGMSFMSFARIATGKERSTIDNYIRTAEVWFIKKTRPAGNVRVVQRDATKHPVKINGVTQYSYSPFVPQLIDLSKLLIVNSRAAKGRMTDTLWEMLVDDVYTCEDVRREHAGTPISGVEPDEYFLAMGPGLFYKVGPDIVCLAEFLNWDAYEKEPLVKEGMDRLFTSLNIQDDDDFIYEALKKTYLAKGPCESEMQKSPTSL